MHSLIEDFGKQLHTAVEIAKAVHPEFKAPVKNILISGLGGSGIGGTIAAEMAMPETHVPIQVSKSYFIPGYVNENTLVIISSYSGNTEETLNALQLAHEKKAQVWCITSGGKIAEFAQKNQLGLVLIPGGMPPRACLGYSLAQQLNILHKLGCIKESPLSVINDTANAIIANRAAIQQEARHIAAFLYGKIPVLYTTTFNEGVAIRWRQQINENSKMLCWHHVVPEMNHNELVGWKGGKENMAVVFLRSEDDYYRNSARIDINKEIIKKYTSNVLDVQAKGKTRIERSLYLVHLGDWVSWYLSELNEVDAVEVKVIDYLKGELEKL